jgi:hypothetical protein
MCTCAGRLLDKAGRLVVSQRRRVAMAGAATASSHLWLNRLHPTVWKAEGNT